MSRKACVLNVLLACILAASFAHGDLVAADVPGILNYQGRVTVSGANFTGTGRFKFALVNSAGVNLWTNDSSGLGGTTEPTAAVNVVVTRGLYSAELGSATNGIPASAFVNNADVRLRVWFSDQAAGGLTQLAPDIRLVPSAFAFSAQSANSVAPTAGNSVATALNDPSTTISVNGAKLADGSVSNAKISDVAASKITGTIATAQITNGAIDATKIDQTTVQRRVTGTAGANQFITGINADGTVATGTLPVALPPSGVAGGDLSGNFPNPTIAAGAVDSSKLKSSAAVDADRAVGTDHVKDGAVTGAKIAANAVDDSKISGVAAGKVTGAIANGQLANSQVTVNTAGGLTGGGPVALGGTLNLGVDTNVLATKASVDAETTARTNADTGLQNSINTKADKPVTSTVGNVASLTATGNLSDSGIAATNVALKNANNNFSATQTVQPSGDQPSLVVKAANSLSTDILTVTSASVTPTKFFTVDNAGKVLVPALPLNGDEVANKNYVDSKSALISGTKPKNFVLAGPTTGADAAPTFRGLVSSDLPQPTPGPGVLGAIGAVKPDGTSIVMDSFGTISAVTGGGGTVTEVRLGNGVFSADSADGQQKITANGTVDLRLNSGGGLSKTLGTGSNELGISPAGVVPSHLSTSVAGNGLNGGAGNPLSLNVNGTTFGFTTGQLNIQAGGVDAGKLATGAAANNIGALTGDVSGTLPSVTINANAVTDGKIASGVNAAKIGSGAISNTEFGFLDGVTSNIQTQLGAKVGTALNSGQIYVGNASNVAQAQAVSGDVALSNAGVATIQTNAVSSSKLQSDASVDANRAVTTNHIQNSAVTGAKIAANAVDNSKISDVAAGKITGSVANAQLANSQVTVNTAGGLTGGGAVALGGTLSLNVDTNVLATKASVDSEAATRAAADTALQNSITSTNGAKADKVVGGGTAGKVAGLDGSGNLTNTGLDVANVPSKTTANTFTTGLQEVRTGAAANTGLSVRGAATQSANLVEFHSDTSTVGVSPLSAITSTGAFTGTAANATNAVTAANALQLGGVAPSGYATSGNNTNITSLSGLNQQAAVVVNPFNTGAGNTGEVRFGELATNGTNYVGFKAPNALTSDFIWTLPSDNGAGGPQVLQNSGSGILSWITVPGLTNALADGLTRGSATFEPSEFDTNTPGVVTLEPNIKTGAVDAFAATPLNSAGKIVKRDMASGGFSAGNITASTLNTGGSDTALVANVSQPVDTGLRVLGTNAHTAPLAEFVNGATNVLTVNGTGSVTLDNAGDSTAATTLSKSELNKSAGTAQTFAVRNGALTNGITLDVQGKLAVSDTSSLTGNVGIGAAPTADKLTVVGATTATGATSINATGTGTTTIGNSTNGGNVAVSALNTVAVNAANVNVTGTTGISGNTTIAGTVTQTGGGQVTLTGNVAAQNGVDVTTANLTVGGSNFTVTPAGTVLTAGSITAAGPLNVTGTPAAASSQIRIGAALDAGVNANGTYLGSKTANSGALTDSDLVHFTDAVNATLFKVDRAGSITAAGGLGINGDLNLMNNLILNVGHADTDFTTGGGLNLKGNLAVNGSSLFVNAADSQVGIGTATPTAGKALDVAGATRQTGDLTLATGGASTVVDAAGIDRSDAAAQTFAVKNSGGGSLLLDVQGTVQTPVVQSSSALTVQSAAGQNLALKVNGTTGGSVDISAANNPGDVGGNVTIAAGTGDTNGKVLIGSDTDVGAGKFTVEAATGNTSINGTLNLNANVIENIGHAGTDFKTDGGLTLANKLTVSTGGAEISGSLAAGGNTVLVTSTAAGVGADPVHAVRTNISSDGARTVGVYALATGGGSPADITHGVLGEGKTTGSGVAVGVQGQAVEANGAGFNTGVLGIARNNGGTSTLLGVSGVASASDADILIQAGALKTAGVQSIAVAAHNPNLTVNNFAILATGNTKLDGALEVTGTVTLPNGAVSVGSIGLTNGSVIIGDVSNKGSVQTIGGDATITNTGLLTIANNAITTDKILDGVVTADKLAADSVTTVKIMNANVTTDKIANEAVVEGKIADGAVTASKIATNAVIEAKILNGAVTTNKIADGAVLEAKLIDGAVTTNKIAANAVVEAKIADGAVTTNKIAANAVVEAKIGTAAVTADKIAANAVEEAKILDGAVTATKIAVNAVIEEKILDGAVTTGKIADLNVTEGKLADGAVLEAKIADGAVTTNKIAANAVVEAKIGTAAVTADKIAANAVEEAKILNGAVTGVKLSSSATADALRAVGTNHIKELAVTTTKILDGAVQNSKLANEAVDARTIALSVAGAGLNGGNGTTLSVNADGTTLEVFDDAVRVKDAGITGAKIANETVTGTNLATDIVISTTGAISTTGTLTAGTITGQLNVSNLTGILGVANGGTGLGTIATGNILYTSGVDTLAATPISAFGRSVIDDADATAARATLELGSIATQNANGVAITGGTINGTAIGGATQSSGAFTTLTAGGLLTANSGLTVTGAVTLPVAAVNVNSLSLADGFIIVGDGANKGVAQAISGDASLANTGALTIAPGAVTSAKIANQTILGEDLALDISISTLGSIATTGTGTITSAGVLTAQNGLSVTGGAVVLPPTSISDTALSTNVGLLTGTQTFSGQKTFSSLKIDVTNGTALTYHASNTLNLDVGVIANQSQSTFTITVSGAAAGDSVVITPNGDPELGLIWCASVTAANTVTVRLSNVSTSPVDPAARTWRADVWKH